MEWGEDRQALGLAGGLFVPARPVSCAVPSALFERVARASVLRNEPRLLARPDPNRAEQGTTRDEPNNRTRRSRVYDACVGASRVVYTRINLVQ
ncbi:hypothetical protein Q3G72_032787 [Acer saccharum]|nr:hypothetical protein Q3G72_032787 [Acer saccharum]